MQREPHTYHSADQARVPWAWDRRRSPVPPGTMRVSDAERAEVANTLCRHFGEGRLTEEEWNERLARVSAAKTRADLGPPLADLPRLDADVASTPPGGRHRWGSVALAIVVVVLVVWSTTGALSTLFHPHVPWLLIVVGAFFFLRRPRRPHRSHHETSH